MRNWKFCLFGITLFANLKNIYKESNDIQKTPFVTCIWQNLQIHASFFIKIEIQMNISLTPKYELIICRMNMKPYFQIVLLPTLSPLLYRLNLNSLTLWVIKPEQLLNNDQIRHYGTKLNVLTIYAIWNDLLLLLQGVEMNMFISKGFISLTVSSWGINQQKRHVFFFVQYKITNMWQPSTRRFANQVKTGSWFFILLTLSEFKSWNFKYISDTKENITIIV